MTTHNHRYRPTDAGLDALDEMCQSPACPCDEALATLRCFVCGARLCQHPNCSQILVRPSGNVSLCKTPSCRYAFDVREANRG